MKTKIVAHLAGFALACFTTATFAAEVDVTPTNLQGWQPQNTPGASGTFRSGPGNPPCGDGSYELSVGADGNGAAQIRNRTYNGTLLEDIDQLSYSTFVTQ